MYSANVEFQSEQILLDRTESCTRGLPVGTWEKHYCVHKDLQRRL